MLIPAIAKNSTTGYKNVAYDRSKMKFQAKVKAGGQHVRLGYFDTAEEAATAYAQSEYGRADAAKLLQPRPAPTPAGAEAIRQAEREGLTLATSSSNTGYKGVTFCPKERSSKKYKLKVWVGGKQVSLGWFATAEEAALCYARRMADKRASAAGVGAAGNGARGGGGGAGGGGAAARAGGVRGCGGLADGGAARPDQPGQ